jgi:peptidoglycan/LPS O-acetylase OafA/YrhL
MPHFKTIAEGLQQKQDNFLLLRFIAAALVIYGHAPALAGGPSHADLFVYLNWGDYSGAIAVQLFFVTSGFLITGSYLRRRNIIDFAWARCLRILPAYAVCLVLSALVLGAAFTSYPLTEYFAKSETYAYITTNLQLQTNIIWDLPGVFTHNHRTTVNGAIWTLPVEIRMYTWVAVLGILGVLSRTWLFSLVVIALLMLGHSHPDDIPLLPLDSFLRLGAIFALGAVCYVQRARIPTHGGVLLACCALAWLLRSTVFYPYVFSVCEALFVFWFAYNLRWHGFNRFGDYSYGIYLWGFPVQQMVAAMDGAMSAYMNALVSFVIALALAVASWHAIEKPALKLKRVPDLIREWWTLRGTCNAFAGDAA